MKKKMIMLASATVVAAAFCGAYAAVKLGVDPWFESNVEALSRNESGGSSYGAYEYDDEFFENTKTFIRCGDCSWASGTSPKYTNC